MSTNIAVVVNERGIFRADYWEQLKQDRAKHLEDTKEQRKMDAFSNEQMTRRLIRELAIDTKMDSTQTNFVARSLIYTLSQLKMIAHREMADILEQAFPVNREGGTGIDTINYEELDVNGDFKLLAGSGTDLEEVGTTLTETPLKVWTRAAAMGWTQKDLERAALASRNGRPVDIGSRKRLAVMRAAIKTKNRIAWNADGANGPEPGFFDYTLNPVTITGSWGSATAEAILTDCLELINEPEKDTEDFVAEVMVLDTTSHTFMNKPRTNTDTSIAQYLLNNTTVRAILKTSYLDSVTSSGNSLSANRVGVVYPRTPEVLEFMLPRDVQFFPVQMKGVHYLVPVLMDCAGLFVYKSGTGGPIAFATMS